MRARGMPHNKDLRRVTAEALNVLAYPPDGPRSIVHPGGKAHRGIQAVIRYDRHKTALGQRTAE